MCATTPDVTGLARRELGEKRQIAEASVIAMA
jgi:hypothetical protein